MKRLSLSALLLLAACGDGEITEHARIPSPIGGADAVVARMKAGENEPWLVVMTKQGDNPTKGARVLLADQGAAPRVEWQDPDHLTISCDGTPRVWSYRNFWTAPNGKTTVAVALDCGQQGWRP